MDDKADDTPAWAYDEDGYCNCCGNGNWKHHMPTCELRDLIDWQAEACAELVEAGRYVYDTDRIVRLLTEAGHDIPEWLD
jgi:hypothetical protein